jgi:hypothetical protein
MWSTIYPAPVVGNAVFPQVASLDPGTHAYSFWEGVPREGKAAFGRLFRASPTLKVRAAHQAAAGKAPDQGMGLAALAGPVARAWLGASSAARGTSLPPRQHPRRARVRPCNRCVAYAHMCARRRWPLCSARCAASTPVWR